MSARAFIGASSWSAPADPRRGADRIQLRVYDA
jgi:hypothetical protein